MNNSMIQHVFKEAFPRSSYNLHIQGGATKTSERSIKRVDRIAKGAHLKLSLINSFG
jgi:hypothetical protein